MRGRDLRRLADPTPTRAERISELDRIAAQLREIADDRSARAHWHRRQLLAWRERLLAVPEPREPGSGQPKASEEPGRPTDADPPVGDMPAIPR